MPDWCDRVRLVGLAILSSKIFRVSTVFANSWSPRGGVPSEAILVSEWGNVTTRNPTYFDPPQKIKSSGDRCFFLRLQKKVKYFFPSSLLVTSSHNIYPTNIDEVSTR